MGQDEELRKLERAAAAGDGEAEQRLEAARARVGQAKAHAGSWKYHDDDCMCPMAGRYCNRDGSVWSCCGACKEDSECSAPNMHPTYWNHPKSSATHAGFAGSRPTYRSNEEIRRICPEAFG